MKSIGERGGEEWVQILQVGERGEDVSHRLSDGVVIQIPIKRQEGIKMGWRHMKVQRKEGESYNMVRLPRLPREEGIGPLR